MRTNPTLAHLHRPPELLVTQPPPQTVEDSVRKVFEIYGDVHDCFLPTDRETGQARGFAFVSMNAKDAEVS